MNRPEQAFQRGVVEYLKVALPPDAWWSYFPMGGGGKLRGAINKSLGARAGTPDILIVWRGTASWFELKSSKGRLSAAQDNCHMLLRNAGSYVYTVRTIKEIESVLKDLLEMPLNARVVA